MQNSSNTENPHNNNNDQLSSDIEILSISKVQNLTRKGAKEPQEPPREKETKEGEGKVGTKFPKRPISKGKGCMQELKTKILGDQDILQFLTDSEDEQQVLEANTEPEDFLQLNASPNLMAINLLLPDSPETLDNLETEETNTE